MIEYCFVLDSKGSKLSPTKVNKAWYLIRVGKATLVSKYPMILKLKRTVESNQVDKSEFICGIDDGSKHVGIAVMQKCKTKNKVIFKSTIEQRNDVKHLMDVRRGYRKYHRQHKRYRQVRYDNRSNSNRKGRIAPSVKQKKDAILRILNRLNKWCNIEKIILEDVKVDIRAITEGKKLYSWQYQKSNRLDENLRKATLMRDGYRCMVCGKIHCRLEVHHIVPKRLRGFDTLGNLITLCAECHKKTLGIEDEFIERFQKLIDGKNIRFDYAQHVMQGKTYLRRELNDIAPLKLTFGSETANKRIDWDIEKSHSNDAIVITGLKPNRCDLKDWIIKPIRRQSKAKIEEVLGYKHRDLVRYTKKSGESYTGYITSLYPEKKQCNITTVKGIILKRYGLKSLNLVWRFNKIYWLYV